MDAIGSHADGPEKLDIGAQDRAGEIVLRGGLVSCPVDLQARASRGREILLPGTGLLGERLGSFFSGVSENRRHLIEESRQVLVEVTGEWLICVRSLDRSRGWTLHAIETRRKTQRPLA
jgi:hypothetical protein